MLTCECLECGHKWTTDEGAVELPTECPSCGQWHYSFDGTLGSVTFANASVDNRNIGNVGVLLSDE